jgi:hypothetical protein
VNDAAPTPSLLDLDEGFLALPRRLCASSFYRSLRPDERSVILEMLLAARYGDGGEFWFAGKRIPLAPGQFIDSEEQLAAVAGTSRKVARNVFKKCITAGVITRRQAHPSGRCPFVTTVLDYDRIRFAGGEAGPRKGQRTGPGWANEGPAKGPHQNKENHVQPGNPGNEKQEPPAASLPLTAGKKRKDEKAPSAFRKVQDALVAEFKAITGTPYLWGAAKDSEGLNRVLSYGREEILDRWRRGLQKKGFDHVGTVAELCSAAKWNRLVPDADTIKYRKLIAEAEADVAPRPTEPLVPGARALCGRDGKGTPVFEGDAEAWSPRSPPLPADEIGLPSILDAVASLCNRPSDAQRKEAESP